MVKLSVVVSDSTTEEDKCTVKIETPSEKQLEKASPTEKSTSAVIFNVISEALGKLK